MTELHTIKGDGLEWSSPSSPSANHSLSGSISSPSSVSVTRAGGATGAPSTAPTSTLGAASSFFATPFAAVGVEYGRTLLRDNAVINSGVGGWLRGSRLRYYFRIDQLYIRRKLSRVLLPYLHSDWTRQKVDDVEAQGLVTGAAAAGPDSCWQPASRDLNAPDLYIGSMALFTYVIALGLTLGMADQFDPSMLSITATRSLVCLLIEVALIYAGFYLSDAPVDTSPAALDLFALAGYKYVALNIDIIIGMLFGPIAFYIVFALLAASTVVFMMRTLHGWVPTGAASATRSRGLYLSISICQLVFSLFLLYPALTSIHASKGITGAWSSAVQSTSPILNAPSSAADSLPTPVEPRPAVAEPATEPEPITPPEAIAPATTPTKETPAVAAPDAADSANASPDSPSTPAAPPAPTEGSQDTQNSQDNQDTPTPTNSKPVKSRSRSGRASKGKRGSKTPRSKE